MLRGLDLFSGIGGIALGLSEWVKPVAYCEIERYAQGVLLSRMADGSIPKGPIIPDVQRLDRACLDMALSLQNEEESMAGKLKKLTLEQVARAVEGYDAGMSLGDLAHVFQITRQAMWDLMRRRTVLRPQLRYGNENHFYRGGLRADARAHDELEHAIRTGVLNNPGVCEACGSSGCFVDGRTSIQGHHDDYNKPLEVRWLCQPCHFEWHRNNQPIKWVEGGTGEAAVDIVCGGFP